MSVSNLSGVGICRVERRGTAKSPDDGRTTFDTVRRLPREATIDPPAPKPEAGSGWLGRVETCRL